MGTPEPLAVGEVQLTEGMDATEREITFVRWSTPLIVSWLKDMVELVGSL